MSFLSGLKKVGSWITGSSFSANLAKTAIIGYTIYRLNRNLNKANNPNATIDEGVRLQINPSAENKIPVVYGAAFLSGIITDAEMTGNNKTMFFCLTISEKTGQVFSTGQASATTFREVYWNDQRIIFKSDGVTVDYTQDRSGVIDRSLEGRVRVYCYDGASNQPRAVQGFAGGTLVNADTLFPGWGASTHQMNNLVFAVVRVDYDRDRGVTSLGNVKFHVENSMTRPGDCLFDYFTNTIYGAGVPSAEVDTGTLTALNNYSDQSVVYEDQALGPNQVLAARYRINGVVDTERAVLENIEDLASSAGSWVSYDVQKGQWGVVINRAENAIVNFDDSTIIGSVAISGTGIEDLYNRVKADFPNRDIRDAADFVTIALPENERNANEYENTLNIVYDLINEPVQAEILGFIELKQSRVDLVIRFTTDYSYTTLTAGDVVNVSNSRVGWTNKAFRVIAVNEKQDETGQLLVDITALEYDAGVYSVLDLFRFTRSDQNGIITIGSIGVPGTPIVTKIEQDRRPRIVANSTSPTGIVERMEFWRTTDVNLAESQRNYTLIGTVNPVGGGTFNIAQLVTFEYDNQSPGNFLIKTRGVNSVTTGPFSEPSGIIEFIPQQVPDQIGPSTALGGIIGALGALELLNLIDRLMKNEAGQGGLFDKIFSIFKDETGVDIVGDAKDGDLVVAAEVGVKSDGSEVTDNVSSIDFKGPLTAEGSGDITVKLADGTKDKQIIAWSKELNRWQTISDCIACDFDNIPPPIGGGDPCRLSVASTLPVSNFSLGTVCPPDSTVPFTGSYFVKFNRVRRRRPTAAISVSSIIIGVQYEIALINNTDFRWWGVENEQVGQRFTAKDPAVLFPQGRLVKDIIVGKRYKIRTPKAANDTSTVTQLRQIWSSMGWEGATANSNPTAGDEFTAISAGVGTGTVDKADGLGWVYPPGPFDEAIPLVQAISPGFGGAYLYGTDGNLEQTLTENQIIIHNDVMELPFAPRQPGKDYYILLDEGIVNYCECESQPIEMPDVWTFTTSLAPITSYLIPTPTSIPNTGNTDFNAPPRKINYTVFPAGNICSTSKIILTFTTRIIRGAGQITVKDRNQGNIVAALPVVSATIQENFDNVTGNFISTTVDFGAIPGLQLGTSYDIDAPEGLLRAANPETTSTVCGRVTVTPAGLNNPSVGRSWGIRTQDPLSVTRFDICPEQSGSAKSRSNVVLTFNRSFKVKENSPAYVYIYEGSGVLHQRFDLRGNFDNQQYGETIYGFTESSSIVNGETVATFGSTLTLNPTAPFKGNTEYYINIDSGVLIDSACNVPFAGITDSTTVKWKTDGIATTPPDGPIFGSLFVDVKFDRPVVAGYGKINVITTSGELITQISSRDWTVVYQDNIPFNKD